MKNLWPQKFEENSRISAKAFLEEQAKLLPTLTDGMVYADVYQSRDPGRLAMRNDFMFHFDIRGRFLEDYRFHLLEFSHDITLYPVKFQIDDQIAKELKLANEFGDSEIKVVETPEELEAFVSAVLRSKRLGNVIGSIIRLSH